MKHLVPALAALVATAACTTVPESEAAYAPDAFAPAIHSEEPLQAPVEIVDMTASPPLPGQLKPLGPVKEKAKPATPVAAIRQGASAARVEPSADGYVNAVQVYPYTEGALYQLYTSPGQVSDIALEAGEQLVSVSAGDTVRWVVGDTMSGSGADARSHVLVKPVAAGLSTNLMIATDRRIYHLELTSLEKTYMAALSWRYPADALASLADPQARLFTQAAANAGGGVRIEDLNFAYRIEGARSGWKPVRVFDDGRQVFIQMPAGLSGSDAPVLFVRAGEGAAELVNYRIRGDYYIVDQLFAAAELRQGPGPRARVQIRRIEAPRGEAR